MTLQPMTAATTTPNQPVQDTAASVPLLQVRDLTVHFQTRAGVVQAVGGVSFDVAAGQIIGLVGESGSGKSATGLALMRLLPQPEGQIVGGSVTLRGRDLVKLSDTEMQKVRGRQMAMTFQDPMTFLNPVLRIGDQIVEGIMQHNAVSSQEAKKRALKWLEAVRVTGPQRVFDSYPHQLSGGLRQRVLIAIALSCQPSLIIADEPTTALDVTIQRQILELLKSIRTEFHSAILLITHDLGVVSELCDRVYVMYAGQIVEQGDVFEILTKPQHPYTRALLQSARSIDEFLETLYAISGGVPSLVHPPTGCRFRERCPSAFARCIEEPPSFPTATGGLSKCWLQVEGAEGVLC